MNTSLLDNPAWPALNTHHRRLAILGKVAARYKPGTLIAAAMPENNMFGLSDLRNLVEIDEMIGVMGTLPEDFPGWEVVQTFPLPQSSTHK